MSKSLGNGVDPVDIAERMGGEIVRLWVASIDFREDMAASENLMARCAELYRKLRNTFRFLLGNLNGFDPVRDRVAETDLLPLDQYMLARTRELSEKIHAWYEAFEFHRVYQAVNEFAIVDLSSFYLDMLKDRMYTFAPDHQCKALRTNRRSGRSRKPSSVSSRPSSASPPMKSGNICRKSTVAKRASTSHCSRNPKRSSPRTPLI